MRSLTDHVVTGDSANHRLVIFAEGEPGPGGACLSYTIEGFDATNHPANERTDRDREEMATGPTKCTLLFQNGDPRESLNGITNEALVCVLIDRMRGFQAGEFKCRENAVALTHFEEGLMWLQKRTRERMARGVEGTAAA